MANSPNDFCDPKINFDRGSKSSGGIGKWIAVTVAVLLAVLLLAWLFGLFEDDAVVTNVTDPDAVIVTTG